MAFDAAPPAMTKYMVRRRRGDGAGFEYAEVESTGKSYQFYFPMGFQFYVRAMHHSPRAHCLPV